MLSTIRSHAARLSLSPTARAVRRERLTYLRPERLATLERLAGQVNRAAVPGDFVECGIALAGSAIVLSTLKGDERTFHGYDVFGMIPAPSERDPVDVHERYAAIVSGSSDGLAGDVYYGYRKDLLDHATKTFSKYGMRVGDGVHLHKGLFDDTLHPSHPIALAHVDSDWFDPVETCLDRIGPWVSEGGFIVLDDYHDYGGCRDAADAFLAGHLEFEIVQLRPSVALQRVSAA